MRILGNIWVLIAAAALIGGGSIGCLGAYIVGMRMSFIGIVISHAAMVGGVLAYLMHWPIFITTLGSALVASLILNWLLSHDVYVESDAVLSVLFSFMMGMIFLGMGLAREDITPLLGLMWGSLLFVTTQDLAVMVILCVLLALFSLIFHKEMKVIMFSRSLGIVSGIPVKTVTLLFLILTAGIITANLNMIGGLLLYSLLTCPAAAAYTVSKNLRAIIWFSILFGTLSAGGGLAISFLADLPTGACITLTSVFIFGVSCVWRKFNPGE